MASSKDLEAALAVVEKLNVFFNARLGPEARAAHGVILSENLTTEEIQRAAKIAVVKQDRYPFPAALIRIIHGSDEAHAEKQWTAILKQVRAGKGLCDDINSVAGSAVSAVGGWRRLHDMRTAESGVIKAQFMKAYKALAGHSGPDKRIGAGS